MTTVSVAKREGLSPFFERSFDDVSEAARFAESWSGMYVTVRDESGQPINPYSLIRANQPGEPGLLPDESAADPGPLCPFCGAPEAVILADDELLHACEVCDRAWYIDEDENVLPADRCPSCESPDVAVDDDGARTCAACGHRFFFDGRTFVDPTSVANTEPESEVRP